MGANKFAMPLLSTLAALVIIVHTAEENFEQDYTEFIPRPLDGEPQLEQWRNMQVAPILTPSPLISQDDVWDESNPEQPLRRRRPGRKRKRRPLASSEDAILSQESYINNDQSRLSRQENKDAPRRRRKKTDLRNSNENNRWGDDGAERKRRKGQRRKRPNQDEWPELSEFNDYRQYERQQHNVEAVDAMETRIPNTNYKKYNLKYDDGTIEQVEFGKGKNEPEFVYAAAESKENKDESIENKDNGSLSEFSSEATIAPIEKINSSVLAIRDKLRDKNLSNYKNVIVEKAKKKKLLTDFKFGMAAEVEKSISKIKTFSKRALLREPFFMPFQEPVPLDPITLKSLLKRSKGKSLSEILQQNNLTLADLLHGNEKALTLLRNEEDSSNQESNKNKQSESSIETKPLNDIKREENNNEYELNEHENVDIETTTLIYTSTIASQLRPENIITRRVESVLSEEAVSSEGPKSTTKHYLRRRYPIRKQIRMRAMTNTTTNTTLKGQLGRDLIRQSTIKYKNNRNISRPREWKEYLPARVKTGHYKRNHKIDNQNITTTTDTPLETTTQEIFETSTDISALDEDTEFPVIIEMGTEPSNATTDNIPTTTETIEELQTENIVVSEKSIISSIKPIVNKSDLTRHAFNNRLKRKRQRQRLSSTEYPDDIALQHVFGEGNFVSASEFIAQTKTTNFNDDNDFSTLEDFLTTEPSQIIRKRQKLIKLPTANNISPTTPSSVTTEESAKIEIEEILNDSLTNARLTEILKERNMTVSELVAHRERGSSHLHLADIFHNASREPNPPEPFLTKSLIEPISKETYPLRALLEANLHDAKTTILDPNLPNNLNIPVVMDFGNNVNEIGENMGIISLFNKFSKVESKSVNDNVGHKDAAATTEHSTMYETVRDGRSFDGVKDSVTWNDLIKLMQTNQHENNDKSFTTDEVPNTSKTNIDEDTIGDRLLVFEDLENIKNLNNKIGSDELLEINLYERNESPPIPHVEISPTSNTRSVTVATISIIGLALILFLLTYAAIKWKQQSIMLHKKHATEDACVPTPVFENRKTQKLNSSTRSKSPMLSANIYTIDSLDPRDGSESPEYMWDSLRKPYQ